MPARRASSPARTKPALSAEDVVVQQHGVAFVRTRWRTVDAKLLKTTEDRDDAPAAIERPTTKRGVAAALIAEVQSVFLPAGYPHTVRPEYLRFQAFDTLQAACSYLRSILTTSAILRGAGVGEGSASPMAAAITWVLRDGVGMFGSLVFSYAVGAQFDVSVKEWRLFADLSARACAYSLSTPRAALSHLERLVADLSARILLSPQPEPNPSPTDDVDRPLR